MRLSVRHTTRSVFAQPMRGVVQSHRLVPSTFDGQRVVAWDVTVADAVFGSHFTDGAGDTLRTMSVLGPLEELTIDVRGEVETVDTAGVLRGHRESVPPRAYLRTTRTTRADVDLTKLAQAVSSDIDALARAHALASAVSDAIAYEPGRSGEATTAAEALAQGAGVCQDHAHALIAAAIIAGLPARYVTGYLLSDEVSGMGQLQTEGGQTQDLGGMRQSQGPQQLREPPAHQPEDGREALRSGEASHAWAEIWVAGLGWVGFDASNRCCPDDRYIRLGSGFDASGAAPIRGVAQGAGEERLDVTVAVQQVQQ